MQTIKKNKAPAVRDKLKIIGSVGLRPIVKLATINPKFPTTFIRNPSKAMMVYINPKIPNRGMIIQE
ncbi:hypothetical protein GCM10011516_11840 [Sphingobacterium cellulitidis]|uniref:Uncharacterized protein n=1 Tax=Sphingobacterium cellulitidis TaxID=1768011 RepID=A0A8H9G0E9_9SPHI|nr:hypothetical protein GCM10011516_11840 [Sphingobacterium soli]